MQLGFVMDNSKCIGCHACTVACKSENDVPLGNFRTWVKNTEQGTYPDVRRSFAVLRCNQCSDAPCVKICPSNALEKLENGVVDLNYNSCVGCKSCMQACPYDALYINEEEGTAEKCHFCNHRTEIGLAPACAVVCPTEAIIPGDFDDPNSIVSQMKASGELSARKAEAGTSPNVLYKEVNENTITPTASNASSGYMWSNNTDTLRLEAQQFLHNSSAEEEARTVYDVPRKVLWDWKVGAYLTTKSIAAGAFLGALPLFKNILSDGSTNQVSTLGWLLAFGFLFLGITMALLVGDLKKPSRFYYILTRPNWNSWLCKGAIIINIFAALFTAWIYVLYQAYRNGVSGYEAIGSVGGNILFYGTLVAALGLASYTAWLFHQCSGRPLWLRKFLSVSLSLNAFMAGCSLLLLCHQVLPLLFGADSFILQGQSLTFVKHGLMGALAFRLLFILFEGQLGPDNRQEEYHRACVLITSGPFAKRHWIISVILGIVIPFVILMLTDSVGISALAGLLALIGLANDEDIFVKAGQALPIS